MLMQVQGIAYILGIFSFISLIMFVDNKAGKLPSKYALEYNKNKRKLSLSKW